MSSIGLAHRDQQVSRVGRRRPANSVTLRKPVMAVNAYGRSARMIALVAAVAVLAGCAAASQAPADASSPSATESAAGPPDG